MGINNLCCLYSPRIVGNSEWDFSDFPPSTNATSIVLRYAPEKFNILPRPHANRVCTCNGTLLLYVCSLQVSHQTLKVIPNKTCSVFAFLISSPTMPPKCCCWQRAGSREPEQKSCNFTTHIEGREKLKSRHYIINSNFGRVCVCVNIQKRRKGT